MDGKSIKTFKGNDGRVLAQIMQSETGKYEIWIRERLNNQLPGDLQKRKGKHSGLAAAQAAGNRIVARYNQDQT